MMGAAPKRLAFMGSPGFAVPALEALHAAGYEIAAVYCQPPRPAHRGQKLTRCAVDERARQLGLEVRTPVRLRRDAAAHAAFAELGLDAAVVAAYGLILPSEMLAAPREGCLNIHASLLPRWRGAAPIQAAIMAGDAETGVTIMRMDEGLDTGPMLSRGVVPIGAATNTAELHDALAVLGARLIVQTLGAMPAAVAQGAEGVTYAAKLTRADGVMDWTQDVAALDRQVRALNPWPGTSTRFEGVALKVLATTPVEASGTPGEVLDARCTVACGVGALRLDRVQQAGRTAMTGEAFLRGVPGSGGGLSPRFLLS